MAAKRLRLTLDPKMPHVARDTDGCGWVRFGGGAALRCRGCGKLVTDGVLRFGSAEARCHTCAYIVRDAATDALLAAGDGEAQHD